MEVKHDNKLENRDHQWPAKSKRAHPQTTVNPISITTFSAETKCYAHFHHDLGDTYLTVPWYWEVQIMAAHTGQELVLL